MQASTPPVRRKAEPRPVPRRNDAYGHLSVPELREYRRALTTEEGNVSYWRRIMQARLDVVLSGTSSRELDTERLRPLLTSERVGAGRRALVEVLPIEDAPPLPSLAELWERRVPEDDAPARSALVADLRAAEGQLSSYRTVLHGRLAQVTGELIARYREAPSLCLSALPLEPVREGSA